MISGALYHRVATYSVKKPVWSWSGSWGEQKSLKKYSLGPIPISYDQTDLRQLWQGRSHKSSGHKWCWAINCLASGLCKEIFVLPLWQLKYGYWRSCIDLQRFFWLERKEINDDMNLWRTFAEWMYFNPRKIWNWNECKCRRSLNLPAWKVARRLEAKKLILRFTL